MESPPHPDGSVRMTESDLPLDGCYRLLPLLLAVADFVRTSHGSDAVSRCSRWPSTFLSFADRVLRFSYRELSVRLFVDYEIPRSLRASLSDAERPARDLVSSRCLRSNISDG